MITLSADRVRSILSACDGDRELVSLLRYHKIRFTCDPGDPFPEYRIPTKKGLLRVFRSRSRFEIHNPSPVPYNPAEKLTSTAWVDRLEVI